MDNFKIDITARGKDSLEAAMKLAFGRGRLEYPSTADGYLIDPEKGLIFFWASSLDKGSPVNLLPFKLDAVGAADFAHRWLAEAEYGPEMDHDGHNTKGFRIYNNAWSRVEGYSGSIVAVKPEWAWHGK